jgi:hypothetical protein
MKQRWVVQRRVEVGDPLRDVRGPRDSDTWRWWWLSLGLVVNRHCADFQSDESVSEALDRVWNDPVNYPLPFQTA